MREPRSAQQGCPTTRPGPGSVQARALHRACLILGGMSPLARRLEVDEAALERWLRGEEEPPEHAFLRAVEVLLLYAAEAGGRPT